MKAVITLFLLCSALPLAAQQPKLPEVYIPSPEASALMKYIDYPVNHGTGLVNIDIPLYEVKAGDLVLPISLSYHASGLKVQEADGWIAAGWTLNVAPAVTRSIKGGIDEIHLQSSSYSTSSRYDYIQYLADGSADEEPDKFYYKLIDKSGGFHFRREDVTSLTNQRYAIIPHPYEPITIIDGSSMNTRLHQFEITDENGVYYLFDEKEYYHGISMAYVPSQWKASKITSRKTNETITFQYNNVSTTIQQGYVLPDIITVLDSFPSGNFSYTDQTCHGRHIIIVNKTNTTPPTYEVTGNNQLKTITCNDIVKPVPNQSVSFITAILRYIQFTNGEIVFESQDGYLTLIKIYNGGSLKRSIRFNRTTISRERRVLNSIEIIAGSTNVVEKYTFSYEGPPPEPSSRNIDHWGYSTGDSYNLRNTVPMQTLRGVTRPGSNTYTFSIGESSREHGGAWAPQQGILRRITYPTGGATAFEYENNQHCNGNKNFACTSLGAAGGLRIAAITDYDTDNTQKRKQIFKYGRYEDGAGIIYRIPKLSDYMYTQPVYYYYGPGNVRSPYRLRTYLSTPITNLFFPNGGAVVYDYVTAYTYEGENNTNYGKTVYQYKYIEPYHTPTDPRQQADYRSGWQEGQLIAQKEYKYENGQYTAVHAKTLTYTRFSFENKNTPVGNVLQKSACYFAGSSNATKCPFGWYNNYNSSFSDHYFYYPYNIQSGCLRPETETVSDYYPEGDVTVTKKYTYDKNKQHLLPGTITTTTSRNNGSEVITETFRYPEDVSLTGTAETARQKLLQDHRLATILEQTTQRGNAVKRIVIPYKIVNGIALPEAMQTNSLANRSALETRIQYKNYTSHGNPVSIVTSGNDETVYLWGYKYQYPIAEIKGATYDEVTAALGGENKIEQLAATISEINWPSAVWNLRTALPQAMVSFYTYSPLIGILTKTDPNGINTGYGYDPLGRLTDIKDYTQSVVRQHAYSYHTQFGKNYIRTRAMTDAAGTAYMEEFAYYDGLGRMVETVQQGASPSGKDIATYYNYSSSFDHISEEGLPVPTNNNNGAFTDLLNLKTLGSTFYEDRAYRSFTYELSPLKRPVRQQLPGYAWASANPTDFKYGTNGSSIQGWRANDDHSFTAITYAAKQLHIARTHDASGHDTRTYKDKQGVEIINEVHDGSQWLQTRYVYDDFGRLKAVVPPAASTPNDEALCFYYRYDERDRVIEEKVPGADWIYVIYDNRDRKVMTQDGNQRANNRWMLYTYDDFNREIRREMIQTQYPTLRETMRALYENSVPPYTERMVMGETYYDTSPLPPPKEGEHDLSFMADEMATVTQLAASNKGRVTMTKVRILAASPLPPPKEGVFLITAFYYDNYGRIIQTVAENAMGSIDRVSNKYNFVGNITATKQVSTWQSDGDLKTLTLETTFGYDAMQRPTTVMVSINGNTPVTVSAVEYDEVARLKGKKLHNGKEIIDYTYNIHDWITAIHSNLFTEELFYDKPLGDVAPQYNGNISSMRWRTARQEPKAYTFEYDGVNRLVKSQYAAGSSSNFSNNYTEQLTYDKNGNIKTLQRYRHLPEPIDNMQYTYNGNQLKQIIDNGTSYGYPAGTTTYMYDLNGNNTLEGTRTRIAYNEINLPQQVQLLGGRGIKNVYAADGRKLKSEAKQGSEYIKEGTKTYCGNLVFDINDELDYILFNEGRILYNVDDSTFSFEYHLRDHLGSTRVAFVPTTSGTDIVQENAYYPFGAPVADLSWSPKSTNRYLREGKEYISDFDWNKYDFTGRTFDPWTLRALQVDPMTAGYYSISPYALFLNNPLRVIDPTGWIVDWYEDLDKTMQFDPKVKSQKDLKDGQRYVGETYQIRNMNGKITEDYRADGSIMFANETSAYNRMWSQATAKKVEESGYALENGKFLVLPDYKNEVDDATPSKYDYSVKDGILLTSDGEILKTIGNVHTHQDPSKNATPSFWTGTGWGDIGHSKAMGGLPIITIGHDGNIHGAFWSIKDSGFRSIPGFGSRKDLLSGNTKLIPWLKTYPTRGK